MDLAVAALSPAGLPAALLPLYQVIYGILLKRRRWDISGITQKLIMTIGATIGLKLTWSFMRPTLLQNLTSSITVPIAHPVGVLLQQWLTDNTGSRTQRHSKLQSTPNVPNTASGAGTVREKLVTSATSGFFLWERCLMHFEYITALKPRYEAYEDAYNDAIVCPPRISRRDVVQGHGGLETNHNDSIRISAPVFHSDAVSRLLDEVGKMHKTEDRTAILTVRRSSGENVARGLGWITKLKPRRPMSSVDLDHATKANLVADIERFWNGEKFYSDRGIPYRRGFLFHGPPGTGKTSMSTALAAQFRCPLFVLNLNEIENENLLATYLAQISRGSILLLEDIDSANVQREVLRPDPQETLHDESSSLRRGVRRTGISLSGLLNSLDGVTGLDDGVIVIMTSNTPEQLDPALIRPGRIDKQIFFGPVSRMVAESIFERMYNDGDKQSVSARNSLKALAAHFADKVPEKKLTPAEIQAFLITHDEPQAAIKAADKWVAGLVAAKEAGRNIIENEVSG